MLFPGSEPEPAFFLASVPQRAGPSHSAAAAIFNPRNEHGHEL